MTPIIIMSLLSIGLIGLIFEFPQEEDRDVDNSDSADDGELGGEPLNLFPTPENGAEDVEADTESPNLPRDGRLNQSGADDDVFIVLTNNTGMSGNTLSGGAGDDFIRTSRLPDYDGVSSLNLFAAHLGSGGNLVFGGVGDDTVEMSVGDTAFGGIGDDTFVVVADPEAIDPDESSAEIKDFRSGNDIIFLQLPPDISFEKDSDAPSDLHSKIEIIFSDGNTSILFDGNSILTLEGIHDISIGVQENTEREVPITDIRNFSDVRSLGLVGLDGLPVSAAAPDIIVSRYIRL